jgi:hypothetical protein
VKNEKRVPKLVERYEKVDRVRFHRKKIHPKIVDLMRIGRKMVDVKKFD